MKKRLVRNCWMKSYVYNEDIHKAIDNALANVDNHPFRVYAVETGDEYVLIRFWFDEYADDDSVDYIYDEIDKWHDEIETGLGYMWCYDYKIGDRELVSCERFSEILSR